MSSATSELFNATSLDDRTVHRRAVELAIWGMPAVSMAAFRASLKRDLDADFGDIVYFSNVMEPRHEFLTANNQTPYVLTFFDLRQGPMVLEVPPASPKTVFFGSAIDSWEVPLADIGRHRRRRRQRAASISFCRPTTVARRLTAIFVVPSPTVFVHIALRPISVGTGRSRTPSPTASS